MNFSLTEEHIMIRDAARDFAKTELLPGVIERDENQTFPNDLVKKIWLAGLGAYGMTYDEAKDQYGKANKETANLFDELVAKGKKVEGDLQEKTAEIKEKTTTTVEERLAQVKGGLKFTSKNAALASQLEDVNSKLDKVINALETKKTNKKAPASTKPAS